MPVLDHQPNVIVLDERCTMLAAERLFRSTRRLRRHYEPTFGPMQAVAQQNNGALVLRSDFQSPERLAETGKRKTLRAFRMTRQPIRLAALGIATLYLGYFVGVVAGLRAALLSH